MYEEIKKQPETCAQSGLQTRGGGLTASREGFCELSPKLVRFFPSPLEGEGVRRTGEGYNVKSPFIPLYKGGKEARQLGSEAAKCSENISFAKQTEMVYSPLTTHYSLCKKAAFTLAEVLITLGIIGVVAALTLPVLRFSTGCAGVDVDGIGCVVNLGTSYSPIDTCDGTSEWDSRFTSSVSSNCSTNYWAGAKKACADIGMELPDRATLQSIYNQKSNYSDLPTTGYFWSSSEYNALYAYLVSFSSGNTSNGYKYHSGLQALCVGD